MYELECVTPCINAGLYRSEGDLLAVNDKKSADSLEATGNWKIVKQPAGKNTPTKKTEKDLNP